MPYDAFLSHNSEDRAHVIAIEGWLRRNGVNCFLDRNNLQPGDVLTAALGKAMEESKSALIFMGPHGEGPWMSEELDSLLNKSIRLARTKNEFRIIPVLLPGADTTNLRWFLRTRLWIDLANGVTDNDDELFRLKAAILGECGDPIPADPDFNPYRGLEAFQIQDARFFFGRAKESAELAQKLRDSRFCAVIGPSGNGKSSLARAGLATEAALRVLPGMETWKRLFVKPGGDLLHSILVQLFADVPNEQRGTIVDQAMTRIAPDQATLSAEQWAEGLDRELRQVFTRDEDRVLLLIDQFEEVFTHRGGSTLGAMDQQERIKRVLDGLACLRTNGDNRWHFVLTMRSDLSQRCRLSPKFWALLERMHLRLDLKELDETGWREAIKGPAARSGAYLEAGLVEAMLKDVYRQRGSTPLLQFALQAVWQLRGGACLTHAAYQSIGGVGNALQQRAEAALAKLAEDDAENGEIARNLFVRLTTPGEGVSDTRRRVNRSELDWENTDLSKREHVLAVLTSPDNRLIVTDGEDVEITHEVLIRDAGIIFDWIENARGEIPMLRRLTHAARRWAVSERNPNLLTPADPPRDLKKWICRATLRLTKLEREFWQRSREQRCWALRDKRTSQRRIRDEQRQRAYDAEQATRRIRKWVYVSSVLALLMSILALVAYRSKKLEAEAARRSEKNLLDSEKARTRSAEILEAMLFEARIKSGGSYNYQVNSGLMQEETTTAFNEVVAFEPKSISGVLELPNSNGEIWELQKLIEDADESFRRNMAFIAADTMVQALRRIESSIPSSRKVGGKELRDRLFLAGYASSRIPALFFGDPASNISTLKQSLSYFRGVDSMGGGSIKMLKCCAVHLLLLARQFESFGQFALANESINESLKLRQKLCELDENEKIMVAYGHLEKSRLLFRGGYIGSSIDSLDDSDGYLSYISNPEAATDFDRMICHALVHEQWANIFHFSDEFGGCVDALKLAIEKLNEVARNDGYEHWHLKISQILLKLSIVLSESDDRDVGVILGVLGEASKSLAAWDPESGWVEGRFNPDVIRRQIDHLKDTLKREQN